MYVRVNCQYVVVDCEKGHFHVSVGIKACLPACLRTWVLWVLDGEQVLGGVRSVLVLTKVAATVHHRDPIVLIVKVHAVQYEKVNEERTQIIVRIDCRMVVEQWVHLDTKARATRWTNR